MFSELKADGGFRIEMPITMLIILAGPIGKVLVRNPNTQRWVLRVTVAEEEDRFELGKQTRRWRGNILPPHSRRLR